MNSASMGKERTIYIRDLLITICQRWRSLFVCLLIGAIVLGVYGWWTSGNETIRTQEQAQNQGDRLGPERKSVIESYASDIVFSTQQMIWQGEYNKNAKIMQLDPFHLYVFEVTYYIDNSDDGLSSSKREALALSYLAKLQESFLGEKVTAVVEKEAYSEQKDYYESPQLIQVDKEELKNGILTFRLYDSEEQTETTQKLKTAMQAVKEKVQSELGEHQLLLIGESGFAYADLDILFIQETNTQRINDLTERIDTIKKMVINSEEQKYLDYLTSSFGKNAEDKPQETRSVKVQRHFRLKYIIIGAFLGLILAAIVILVKYLTSNAVKSQREIEETIGLQVLGSFEGNSPFYLKRKTKPDQWLRKKKNKTKDRISAEEMADVIATKIKIESEKADLHNLCLAVDKKVFDNSDFLEQLIDKIGGVPVVEVIRNIPEQSVGLEEMAAMDGAVLIEQIDRSGFDDLIRINELCRSYSVKVIGSIVVE